MKVEKKEFGQFLKSISLSGDFEIKDIIMKLSSPILVTALDRNRIVGLSGKFKTNSDDKIGEIGIGDLSLFRRFVSSFQDNELILQKNSNKLNLTTKKDSLKVNNILTNTDYIKNKIPENKLDEFLKSIEEKKSKSFTISEFERKKLVKYSSAMKTDLVRIEGMGNEINFITSKNENDVISKLEISKDIGKVVTEVKSVFIDILSLNEGVYSIEIEGDNQPIYIGYESELFTVDYLIAPSKVEGD
jgi:hypothetical protein